MMSMMMMMILKFIHVLCVFSIYDEIWSFGSRTDKVGKEEVEEVRVDKVGMEEDIEDRRMVEEVEVVVAGVVVETDR
jgi:hypothetical protein